jgi:hypothetical protein
MVRLPLWIKDPPAAAWCTSSGRFDGFPDHPVKALLPAVGSAVPIVVVVVVVIVCFADGAGCLPRGAHAGPRALVLGLALF